MPESALAAYQRALLAALHRTSDGDAIARALRGDPALAPFSAWLDACEPRCLEVAAGLAQTWGRREP